MIVDFDKESICQITWLVQIDPDRSFSPWTVESRIKASNPRHGETRGARFIGNSLRARGRQIIFAVLRVKRRGCFAGRLFGSRARRGRTTNLYGTARHRVFRVRAKFKSFYPTNVSPGASSRAVDELRRRFSSRLIGGRDIFQEATLA